LQSMCDRKRSKLKLKRGIFGGSARYLKQEDKERRGKGRLKTGSFYSLKKNAKSKSIPPYTQQEGREWWEKRREGYVNQFPEKSKSTDHSELSFF